MLYALLLLGLLPAAFLIDRPESGDDDDDFGAGADTPGGAAPEPDLTPGDSPGSDPFGLHPPEDAGPGSGPGDMPDEDTGAGEGEPATLEIPADAGDVQISGFRPGIDSLTLRLDSADTGFYMSQDSETGDGMLHIENAEGERVVTFEGLDGVPLDDIAITVTDPATGLQTAYSLRAVAGSNAATLDPVEGEAPLDPLDPDAPEIPAPGGDDDPLPVDPVDPDAPEVVTPGEDGDPPPLEPEDPDTPTVPVTADPDDPLDPVDTVYEELSLLRGDGDLDALLSRDSDSNGPSGATTDTPVLGTAGDDTLSVGAGESEVSWLAGTPVLGGTPGLVDAGDGDDTVLSAGGAYVFGGAGNDVLTDTGTGAALYGGAGDDTLAAGPGGAYLDGGDGDDLILGGDGDDVIEGGAHRGGAGPEGDDDIIDGGGGNDVIRGGAGADRLSGGDGDDIIDHAGRAEERVPAEERRFDWHVDGAADRLDGGAGDDTLVFGDGDTANGGSGADQFHLYTTAAAPAVIEDFVPGQDFLRITLDPSLHIELPSVEVTLSDNGQDSLVTIDGVLVAVLQGTPSASIADLYVEVLPDLAA